MTGDRLKGRSLHPEAERTVHIRDGSTESGGQHATPAFASLVNQRIIESPAPRRTVFVRAKVPLYWCSVNWMEDPHCAR
jgi:hypothetical protein